MERGREGDSVEREGGRRGRGERGREREGGREIGWRERERERERERWEGGERVSWYEGKNK